MISNAGAIAKAVAPLTQFYATERFAMKKRCLRLFLNLLLLLWLPVFASLGEDVPERTPQLTIGLFTPDLFEADAVFDEAVCCLRETYPQLRLKYCLLPREPVSPEALDEVDVLFINENYHLHTSETAYLSPLGEPSSAFVDLWGTPIGNTVKEALFPMDYLTDDDRPLLFLPIKVDGTVLNLDIDIERELQEAGFSDGRQANRPSWEAFAQNAEALSQFGKTALVYLLEDQFTNLPTAIHQIAAYLHIQNQRAQEIDESAILANLSALKRLNDAMAIGAVDMDTGFRGYRGLYTSTIALYQSGGDHYAPLPCFSANMDVCPADGILAAIPLRSANQEAALAFVQALLSQRCQGAYNVMGVIRKDISHGVHTEYEAFSPPEEGNEEVYRQSLRCAAFPYLTAADMTACQDVLARYFENMLTTQEAYALLSQLILYGAKEGAL